MCSPCGQAAAQSLHDRAQDFQNQFQNQQWGPVRVIHCWPLLLVEQGLALHLGQTGGPRAGYKLAADWAQHYDSRYGNGLNGPSRGKLQELVRFMFNVEAQEEAQAVHRRRGQPGMNRIARVVESLRALEQRINRIA